LDACISLVSGEADILMLLNVTELMYEVIQQELVIVIRNRISLTHWGNVKNNLS
jgi:hypothetical protein